jgi:hypothetical protein
VFGVSVESGGQFCVGVFGGNVASAALKTFFHLIWFVKKARQFYEYTSVRFVKIILQWARVVFKEYPTQV